MRLLILFTSLLISTQALAHFEIGTYKGLLANDKSCGFTIESYSFKNDQRHPLNISVQIKLHFLDDMVIQAGHLPIVDSETGSVRPKPRVLTAVIPNDSGATAVELFMDEEGPEKIISMTDNYRDPSKNSRVVCEFLEYEGE